KPTPEQFGLTTLTGQTVSSLIEEKRRRDGRREKVCLLPCMGLGIIGGVTLYVSNLPRGPESIGVLIAYLVTSAFFALGGCIAGLLIGGLLLWIVNRVVPEPLRYKTLNRYLEALTKYEEWFVRTQAAFWEKLPGRRFEIEVTNLFNRAGYRARLTPAC